jgi:TorA maturation chaperone TorD
MKAHQVCKFEEFEATFYMHYQKVQTDEQMYMALKVIKQGGHEKVEVYYECILKLANCLQHQVDDNLLTTFFRACLQPYFQMATTGMKKDTLFKHKEVIITCEENIRNANEYQKLFKRPTKQEKASKGKRIDVI